jgi:tetratricopeptide (TPR) repeat protein
MNVKKCIPRALLLIMVGLLAGCEATIIRLKPNELPSQSKLEALKVLRDQNINKYLNFDVAGCNSNFSALDVHKVCNGREIYKHRYRDYPEVVVRGQDFFTGMRMFNLHNNLGKLKAQMGAINMPDNLAITFAKSWHTLAVSPPPDPAASAFAPEAKRYLQAGIPTELPESVRRYRVQAEAAVKEKRFIDAAESYDQALRDAPWWPQGHFNLALIYGELELYPEAMAEMRKYLLLTPDAPNVRAAQDKIYEWEAKAKSTR